MLFHTADAGAALPVGDVPHLHAADGHRTGLRLIQAQQELEHGALARTGAAHQRDLLPLFHGHGKILQNVPFPIAEGDVCKFHIAPGSLPARGRDRALRLVEKGIDAPDTRHGRLNGLDFHAQALDGGEDAGDVVDDSHRGAHRHAEQGQELCVPRSGEQHHDADHSGIQQQHHRRIDSIIKIGALHGGIAVTDAPVIPALHVILQTQRPDGADVVQSLGHLPGDRGDRAAVVQLRGQHPLLDITGKHGKQWQHQQQDQRKAGVFYRNDPHDGDDAAGICCHADDTGSEQGFHRVHIARKAGGHLAGILLCQCTGGQAAQLPGHLRAQGMGHPLAKEHQQAFLRRGEHTFQCKAAEVEQHGQKGQREARGQTVDDPGQQQGRQQGCRHRSCHPQHRAHREKAVRSRCHPDGSKHAVIIFLFHAPSPPFRPVWLSYSWR